MKIVFCLLLPIAYCLFAKGRIRLFFFCLLVGGLPTVLFAQTWHAIPDGKGGYGVHGAAYSLKSINGELYVGGGFAPQYGGGPGKGIAKFNGSTWDSLGPGLSGIANAIELYNGEIYACGNFSGAYSGLPWPNNGVTGSEHIARWDGTKWKALGATGANQTLITLKYNNDLYIGGMSGFQSIGGISCKQIVRWNGSKFDNMQEGVDGPFFPEVYAMEVYKGQLYVGGNFTKAGNIPASYIARWDGSKWDSVGTGTNYAVKAFAIDTVQDVLYVSGGFDMAGGIPVKFVAKWDGTNWSAAPPLPTYYNSHSMPNAMKFFKGELYLGLDSYGFYGAYDTALVRLDSNQWNPVYGPNGVKALEIYKGNLYVGGFNKIDTVTVNGIACYGDSCPGTPITLTLPYGVQEFQVSGLKFKVYPNPAREEINIDVEGADNKNYFARIYNSVGAKITEQKFVKQTKISTANFSKGIYQVQVCNKNGEICYTEKIILK